MPLEAVYRYSLLYLTPWAILPLLTDLVVPGSSLACLMLLARRRRDEDDLVEPVTTPVSHTKVARFGSA